MTTLGEEIIQGLKEAIAYQKGELTEADGIIVHTYPSVPDTINVKTIRSELGLTQEQFAQFGFSVRAIQNWENNRRKPTGAARALLTVIKKSPDVVLDALRISPT